MVKSRSIRLFTAFTFAISLFSFFMMPLVKPVYAAAILHVSTSPAGVTCTDWSDSCALQDALAIAAVGDEIWVKAGVYTPGAGRYDSFVLKNGVAIYGGFDGSEMMRSSRNYTDNLTVLSGDIAGDDAFDPDGVVLNSNDIFGSNSFHVVDSNGAAESAVLDGFTITAGQADDVYPHDSGGGLLNIGGNPTLRHLNFYGNTAFGGGAIYNEAGSPPMVGLLFSGNSAINGGAIYNFNSSPQIDRVKFNENRAEIGGGMLNDDSSSALLSNAVFYANEAVNEGGGIANRNSSHIVLLNSTMNQNLAASEGGGIYNEDSSPSIMNTIIWGNIAPVGEQIRNNSGSFPIIAYSDVENSGGSAAWDSLLGVDGGNNIDDNPAFANVGVGDLRLRYGSPVIDLGDNASCPAFDHNTGSRPADGDKDGTADCDIGAYEVQYIRFYAAPTNQGSADCRSWGDACLLSTALGRIEAGGSYDIWVQEGVHKPTVTSTDVTATFQLTDAAAIYGGFVGWETLLSQRNYANNITVLSGDIDNNDIGDANGIVTNTNKISGTNSYHVVTGDGVTQTAVLDGFSITAGYIPSVATKTVTNGAGIINDGGSPTLVNLTLSGNYAHGSGGGMYNNNSTMVLTNITFFGNQTQPYLNFGGGLYNRNSTLHLSGGQFINNMGGDGGGFANSGSLNRPVTLIDTTFIHNVADRGGGLADLAGPLVLSHTTFTGNRAIYAGGGILLETAPAMSQTIGTFYAITLTGNTAYYEGGGVYNNGQVTIRQAAFISNTTTQDHGGGLYNNRQAVIEDSTFIRNQVDYNGSGGSTISDGGGIYNSASGELQLRRSLLTGNTADDGGGGLANRYGVIMLTGNTFAGNDAFGGGGIAIYSGTNTLVDTTFISNTADYYGGGIHIAEATVPLTNTVFISNTAATFGGGMYNGSDAKVYMQNGTFLANRSDSHGGGVANGDNSFFSGRNLVFDQNQALGSGGGLAQFQGRVVLSDTTFTTNGSGVGGGIWLDTPSAMSHTIGTFYAVTLTGNTAYYGGGGVYNNGDVTIRQATFISNTTTQEHGGGLYNNRQAVIENSTFMSNHADFYGSGGSAISDGGGIYNSGSGELQLNRSLLTANTADDGGGGLTNHYGVIMLADNTFTGNDAFGGGGIAIYSGTNTLSDTTFVSNTADYYGGGLSIQEATVPLTNTVFISNTAVSFGGGMYNGSGAKVYMQNGTFLANRSDSHGGGVANDDNSSFSGINLAFDQNRALSAGGGLAQLHGRVVLSDTTFTANRSEAGGGIWLNTSLGMSHTIGTFYAITLTGNTVHYNGGGGMYSNGEVTINRATFISNTTGLGGGGGLYNSRQMVIENSTFTSNHADSQSFGGSAPSIGGGIYNSDSGQLQLRNTVLTANTAEGGGGGLFNHIGEVTLVNNNMFARNEAAYGGGVAIYSGTNALVGATFISI